MDVAATGEGVTSLGSVPLSGTSFAAPVVSGLAALIRARFPTLTARQVMQRIESTAHHPPSGWNPFVGNGAVDALAAVSTDANPPGNTAKPPTPVPLSSPPAPGPPELHRPDDRPARRGRLPGRSWRRCCSWARPKLGGQRGQGPLATVSRATDAFALPSSGPHGNAANNGDGIGVATDGRPSARAASSSWIANRTPVSVMR